MSTISIILFISFNLFFISIKPLICAVLCPLYLRWRRKKFNTENEIFKFGASIYRFLFYTASIIIEVSILRKEDWIFKSKLYTAPLKSIPFKFKVFYILQISFYTAELINVFFEVRQREFIRIAFHHTVAFLLLLLSFNNQIMKLGFLIIFLHNLSDPILELSKQEYYLMKYRNSNVLFFIFMISFMGLRLLVFPRWLVVAAVKYIISQKTLKPIFIFELTLLISLQLLHFAWSKSIIKIFLRIINSEEAIERKKKFKKVISHKKNKESK